MPTYVRNQIFPLSTKYVHPICGGTMTVTQMKLAGDDNAEAFHDDYKDNNEKHHEDNDDEYAS